MSGFDAFSVQDFVAFSLRGMLGMVSMPGVAGFEVQGFKF